MIGNFDHGDDGKEALLIQNPIVSDMVLKALVFTN
jgi:hypothetical protein